VEAPELKAWMERVAPGGRIPDGARGLMSPPVEMPDLIALGRKALVTGDDDTSAGAFVQTDYTGIYEPLGRRPTTVLDLISMRPTQSDLVEFVRQTVQASQAAPVAEANVTNYTGATGEVEGAKPEATVAFEKVQLPVKTIAVWLPATKRGLSDAGQLRGLIDQELRDDIQEELEDQVITGDGIGENLTGVLNTAGVLTQAWDTDILRTARRAITTLRVTGRSRPTAWALHPNDWETIDLTQDAQNRYYFGGPLAMGTRTLWGVPVVECEGVTEGVGILGDWRKAVLWNRERSTIQVSDSHEDFFVRNMVAILAEMRAAFGLIRPSAFVEVDLTAGS
jgi:HK97 family phage major capsid protein